MSLLNNPFEKTIETFSEDIKNLARETRKLVFDVLPETVEVVWVQQKKHRFWHRRKEKHRTFLLVDARNTPCQPGF